MSFKHYFRYTNWKEEWQGTTILFIVVHYIIFFIIAFLCFLIALLCLNLFSFSAPQSVLSGEAGRSDCDGSSILITNMSPERIWKHLLCFLHFILYDPGLYSHPDSCILSLCASRLKLIYSPGWRGHPLTKTGTSGGEVFVLWFAWLKKNKDLTLLSLDNLSWDLAVNVKLSERGWEASHGVCSGDGAASGVQPGPCVHNRWKPLLPAPQWISSKLSWYTYTPPFTWTHSPGNLPFYLIFSFQQQVIQIRLHSVRRIYKRRHGLRPLVSTTGTASVWIMILASVGLRFNPGVCVSMPPPPGSRGVLYWEWFLLRHLPEVLQHSRQRRGLLLHCYFPRWDGRPLLTVIKIKPKTFKTVF